MTQKERLVERLKRGPADNTELATTICLAFNQRLNEMKRAGKIDFHTTRDPQNQSHVWYHYGPEPTSTITEADGQMRFIA